MKKSKKETTITMDTAKPKGGGGNGKQHFRSKRGHQNSL